jgi:serine/threonine protein kinase
MSQNLRDKLQSTLGDAYTLERELGGGGMSRVFVAEDNTLGRKIVVKMLPAEMAAGVSVERFKREIQVVARLQHPHIVPVLSAGQIDGLPFYTMPFVKGESLRARLTRSSDVSVNEAVHLLRDVAAALAYAHSEGVVHRDIKPDNVIVSGGVAVVADFGVSKAVDVAATDGGGAPTGITSLGIALGTPAYMSPEQALGERELDGRSDVYSLGVVGYHMLTGEQPFRATSAAAMLVKHVSEIPPKVRQKRADVPPYLATAIDRALAKRPEDRWSNASEFRDALAGAIIMPVQAYPAVDPRSIQNGVPAAVVPRQAAEPAPAGQWQPPVTFAQYWQPSPPPPGLSSRELRRWAKTQERQRKDALKQFEQHQTWRHAATLDNRIRAKHSRSYDDKPLIDRVLAFRGAFFRFAFITPTLLMINAIDGDFPWFLFPSAVLLFDALRRAGSIWSDGIGPLDAFKKGIRIKLANAPIEAERAMAREADTQNRRSVVPAVGAAPPKALTRADRFVAPPPDRSLSNVPADVMNGAHGAAIRRAMDDSSVVRGELMRLGPLERDMLPDVGPTVDALTERVASLAITLHRLDMDVSGATLGTLDQRINALKGDATSPDRQRTLTLLERQRTSLHDLLSRRQALLTQLDSAGLALQNLKLDLLKLRSAGVTAAIDGGNSATQEARSVSRDIGRIMEVADDIRGI